MNAYQVTKIYLSPDFKVELISHVSKNSGIIARSAFRGSFFTLLIDVDPWGFDLKRSSTLVTGIWNVFIALHLQSQTGI